MFRYQLLLLIIFLSYTEIKSQISSANAIGYKFETFEKIKLGVRKADFETHLKSLKLKKVDYFTQMIIGLASKGKPERYLQSYFQSNQFDFDEFKVKDKKTFHPTLIVPESIDNKTVTSITLLLGHTCEPHFLNKIDSLNYSNTLQFRQDINKDLFFKIVNLYLLKYGEPEYTIDSTNEKQYYLLFETRLEQRPVKYTNYILSWETEYYTIEIFPGLDLNANFSNIFGYGNSTNALYSNLSTEPLRSDQKPCFTVPHIKYTLNSKGIKFLGINKINI